MNGILTSETSRLHVAMDQLAFGARLKWLLDEQELLVLPCYLHVSICEVGALLNYHSRCFFLKLHFIVARVKHLLKYMVQTWNTVETLSVSCIWRKANRFRDYFRFCNKIGLTCWRERKEKERKENKSQRQPVKKHWLTTYVFLTSKPEWHQGSFLFHFYPSWASCT